MGGTVGTNGSGSISVYRDIAIIPLPPPGPKPKCRERISVKVGNGRIYRHVDCPYPGKFKRWLRGVQVGEIWHCSECQQKWELTRSGWEFYSGPDVTLHERREELNQINGHLEKLSEIDHRLPNDNQLSWGLGLVASPRPILQPVIIDVPDVTGDI